MKHRTHRNSNRGGGLIDALGFSNATLARVIPSTLVAAFPELPVAPARRKALFFATATTLFPASRRRTRATLFAYEFLERGHRHADFPSHAEMLPLRSPASQAFEAHLIVAFMKKVCPAGSGLTSTRSARSSAATLRLFFSVTQINPFIAMSR